MVLESLFMAGGWGGNPATPYRRYFWLLVVGWTTAVAGWLAWNLSQAAREARSLASETARALLEKDLLYREWSILHGGVYLPKSGLEEKAALAPDEEREILTPSGRVLTLLNPAIVSRQVFELQDQQRGIRGHITSLTPHRPENRPDAWERRALEAFGQGSKEVSSVEIEQGERYYRMMRPLFIKASCRQCHEEQDRQVGQLRGGISVSVPLSRFAIGAQNARLIVGHTGWWLLGLGGLGVGARNLQRHVRARRRAEEQMRLQLAVLQSTANAIIFTGRNGVIQWVNPALTSLTGYSPAEAIGQNPRLFSSGKQDRAFYQQMWKTILSGRVWRGELINKRKDGSLYPEELTITPVTGAGGQITHFIAIKQDISERKRLEDVLAGRRRELEGLVAERTAKLKETIGELEQFSHAIIHDMRAPLRAMQSFAAMLGEEFAACLPPKGLDYCRRIQTAANRMDRLITDSLQYSKVLREELPMTPVDVPALLRGIIESYPNLQPPAAEIQVQVGELKVQANEAALTQCFSNLLDNAVKFVAPGVKPRVRVWAEEAPRAKCHVPGEEEGAKVKSPGPETTPQGQASGLTAHPSESSTLDSSRPAHPSVLIWVEDNGIGIPKTFQARIFDMFQRGTNLQEGTGIGLAIVRKAVQRMGGQVGVDSVPGKGSRFWLGLPRA